MEQTNNGLYKVPEDKVDLVLKALNNSARYNILCQLSQGPMNISELARAINISQPTVTTYINQLEKAGLVFCRLQKSSTGYNKICQTAYTGFSLSWQANPMEDLEAEYKIDMPVGHYSAIECTTQSFLATQAGIISSSEDFSRFFHPIRMQAELLAIGQGNVRYLFPYNIPETHKILYLELSAEISIACDHPDAFTDITIAINNHHFTPHRLLPNRSEQNQKHRLKWYPKDMKTSGELFVWRVEAERSMLNSMPEGNITLADLNLQPMQPMEVSFEVQSSDEPVGGMIIFGKSFGQYDQDIRLTIVYEQDTNHG